MELRYTWIAWLFAVKILKRCNQFLLMTNAVFPINHPDCGGP